MPNIKLRDGSGVEQVYEGVDTISVPLADGSGTYTYGMTDDELKFSDDDDLAVNALSNRSYLSQFGTFYKYIDRWNIDDCKHLEYVFSNTPAADDVSNIVIRSSTKPHISIKELDHIFDGFMSNKLPKVDASVIFNHNLAYGLSGSGYNLTSAEINRFLKEIKHLTSRYYNGHSISYKNPDFTYFLSGKENISDITEGLEHIQHLINNMPAGDKLTNTSGNNNLYYYMYSSNYSLVKAYFPVYGYSDWPANFTSNFNWPIKLDSSYSTLNSVRFGTEDGGTPKVVHWKSQVFDLSGKLGYNTFTLTNGNTTVSKSDIGFDEIEDNLFYKDGWITISTATEQDLANIKANYDRLKGSGKPYLCGSETKTTFDGQLLYVSLLYSNYNHASAVETINSLPDTSAYLTSAGGTNTIKFKKYSGALTDAGGTNNLTEEEIAVAAAKGWTVTLV